VIIVKKLPTIYKNYVSISIDYVACSKGGGFCHVFTRFNVKLIHFVAPRLKYGETCLQRKDKLPKYFILKVGSF